MKNKTFEIKLWNKKKKKEVICSILLQKNNDKDLLFQAKLELANKKNIKFSARKHELTWSEIILKTEKKDVLDFVKKRLKANHINPDRMCICNLDNTNFSKSILQSVIRDFGYNTRVTRYNYLYALTKEEEVDDENK